MGISVIPAAAGGSKEKRVDAFTASGTWTVPSGVTYAIAHTRGAGGGSGRGSGGTGGTSSVDFTSTVTAAGGIHTNVNSVFGSNVHSRAGAANSGQGAIFGGKIGDNNEDGATMSSTQGGDGAYICEGQTVTPGDSITVTVGAAGTAGTNGAAGGSGFVYIEYYE